MEKGFDAVVSKPFNQSDLQHALFWCLLSPRPVEVF